MNALNDPQGRGRSASSPEFRKHAGMVVRSDRGDKKHREGFFLAVECMQSHLLKVNCHEVTLRCTEASGGIASRHASTSKLSQNLTHNVSVQLPLVCW